MDKSQLPGQQDKAMTLFTEAEARFHSEKYDSHTSTFELRLLTHNLIKDFTSGSLNCNEDEKHPLKHRIEVH